MTFSKAPVHWLLAGLVVAVLALVVASVWREITGGVLGWVLAGPVAIGLLCLFSVRDAKARENPWYAISSGATWWYRALVVVALVGIGVSAWTIADFVARL